MRDSLRMTSGRAVALAAGVPAMVALIGLIAFGIVGAVGQASFTLSQSVPVVNHTVTARVDGDITLRQVTSQAATLSGRVRYSLVRPDVTRNPDGGIGLDCRVFVGDCSFDATLTVPRGDGVSLSTGGGDLDVGALTGPLTLSTDGGDVNAGALTGQALRLDTSGGDFTASSLNSLNGSLRLSTLGGDVDVDALTSSDATIESSGGDVTMTAASKPPSLTIDSLGGDVDLVLPGGTYNIETNGQGGDVNVGPGLANDHGASRTIIVDSSGGNITITAVNLSAARESFPRWLLGIGRQGEGDHRVAHR